MSTTEIINLSMNLCAFIISFMLLIATLLAGNLRQQVYRWFFVMVILSLLTLTLEFLIVSWAGTPGTVITLWIAIFDFSTYVFGAVQFVALAFYMYEYLRTKRRMSRKLLVLVACCSVGMVVLAVVAQINGMYGWLDEMNEYHQQDTYWIFGILPSLCLGACVVVVLRSVSVLQPREWIALLLYPVVAFICYVVEIAYADLWLAYFGGALALFFIYINIQAGLGQQLKAKEAELAESRIAVMLSQIQPHFLYNALAAISRLCYDNPKAYEALLTFSTYLRVNMDSLNQKTPIPFEKELEHVRQYVFLEKLRFEERLTIVYEIETTDFAIPPLTLQPMVENAVRHGINQKRAGGTVRIRAEEKGGGYLITVADDGIGCDLDAALKSGGAHTGIANVQGRLAAMCGGRLTVTSQPGSGTVAVITIPKGKDSSRNPLMAPDSPNQRRRQGGGKHEHHRGGR